MPKHDPERTAAKKEAEHDWTYRLNAQLEKSRRHIENRQVGEWIRHNRPEIFQLAMDSMIKDEELRDRA